MKHFLCFRVPTEAANQLPPAEFAAVLTQKLEKLKREQEINDRLSRKLSEECGSMVSQSSSRSLADILREKLILPDDGDGDQSILDDHVSRVWTDKTPLRLIQLSYCHEHTSFVFLLLIKLLNDLISNQMEDVQNMFFMLAIQVTW